MRQRTTEAVQLRDDQHIPVACVGEGCHLATPVGFDSRRAILELLRAFRCGERIELQRWILVKRADARSRCMPKPVCPFSRPATILSGFPFSVQGFRTH